MTTPHATIEPASAARATGGAAFATGHAGRITRSTSSRPVPDVGPHAAAVQSPANAPRADRFRCVDVESLLDAGLRAPATSKPLIGFEVEGQYLLDQFLPEGTEVAHLPYGKMTVEGVEKIKELIYEAISDAAPNPYVVHTFGRGTTEFFLRQHEHAGRRPPLSATWPSAHVEHNLTPAPTHRLDDTAIVELQTSSGCDVSSGVLSSLMAEKVPRVARQAEIDVARAVLKSGTSLGSKGLSLLYLICCEIRSAGVRHPDRGTAHTYFRVPSRGAFSDYFADKSKATKRELKKLLIPDNDDALPVLMQAVNLQFDQLVFGTPYNTDWVEFGPDGLPSGQREEVHVGPTIRDWLISIVYPSRFGRTTDLRSPPPGHDPNLPKVCGLGSIRGATGYIFEFRKVRPKVFPVTGLLIALMLQYKDCQKINSKLPKVDFVDGGEEEERNLENFDRIGEFCFILVRLAECIYERRPVPIGMVRGFRNCLIARDCIEAHSGIDDVPHLIDELEGYLDDPPSPAESGAREALLQISRMLTRHLHEAYPRIGEALFRTDWQRWEAAVAAFAPDSRASSPRPPERKRVRPTAPDSRASLPRAAKRLRTAAS